MHRIAAPTGAHPIPLHKIDFPLSINGKFNNVPVEFLYTSINLNDITHDLYLTKTESQPYDVVLGQVMKMDDGQVLIHVYEKTSKSFGLLRLVYFTPRMEFEVALLKNSTTSTGMNLLSHGFIDRNIVFDANFASAFTSKTTVAYFLYDGYWSDTLDSQLTKRGWNEQGIPMFVLESTLREFEEKMTQLRTGVPPEEQIINPLCLPSNVVVKLDENQDVIQMACFNYSLAFHPDEWENIPPEVIKNMIALIVSERYVLTEITEILTTNQGINFNTPDGFPDYVFINIIRKSILQLAPKALENTWQIIPEIQIPTESLPIIRDLLVTNQMLLPQFDRDLSPRQTQIVTADTTQTDISRKNRYKSNQQRKDFVKRKKFAAIKKAKIVQEQSQRILDAERVDRVIELQKQYEELQRKFDDEARIAEELRKKEEKQLRKEAEKLKQKEREEKLRLETRNENQRKQRALVVLETRQPHQVQHLLAKERQKVETNRRSQQTKLTEYKISEIQQKQNLVTREYAIPREIPLPQEPKMELENRAPWEFRRYVKDNENPL